MATGESGDPYSTRGLSEESLFYFTSPVFLSKFT